MQYFYNKHEYIPNLIAKVQQMNPNIPDKKAFLLDFATAWLAKIQIDVHIQQNSLLDLNKYDHGLRQALIGDNLRTEYAKTWPQLPGDLTDSPRTLFLQDLFGVEYVILPYSIQSTAIIGPFLMEVKPIYKIEQMARSLKIPSGFLDYLEQYFVTLPCVVNADAFIAFINTLGEWLIGTTEPEYLHFPAANLPSFQLSSTDEYRADLAGQFVQRYLDEDKGLAAVTKGDYLTAEKYLLPGGRVQVEVRQSDPIRNYKNYIISLSALLRKAVQKGNVHPVYIDDLSRQIAIRIEKMTTLKDLSSYSREVIRKYCFLVQPFLHTNYSLTVQKIIHIIQLEPEGQLSLSAIAARLGLSRTYISGLFKNETGMTFTNYVNKSRMEYAATLLNCGFDSIRDVSVACGIPDQSYFSKLFKHYYGVTPKEYRSQSHE